MVKKYDEEDEYYLTPNDGPCTLITLLQLKDNNFNECEEVIEITQESKNKLSFLEGSIPHPKEDDPKF